MLMTNKRRMMMMMPRRRRMLRMRRHGDDKEEEGEELVGVVARLVGVDGTRGRTMASCLMTRDCNF